MVSRRFMPTDLFVLALDLARGVSEAVAATLGTAQSLAAGHANYKVDQAAFHEQAALQIETMTSGESDA